MTPPSSPLRPLRQVLVGGILLGGYLALTLSVEGLIALVPPVMVWVDGSPTIADQLTIDMVNAEGAATISYTEKRWEKNLIAAARMPTPQYGLVVGIAPDAVARVERITVRIGRRRWEFDSGQFRSEWLPWEGPLPPGVRPGWEVRRFPDALSASGSLLPWLGGAINYEGDAALARYMFLNSVFLFWASCFALVLVARSVGPRYFPDAPAWLQQVFGSLTPAAGKEPVPRFQTEGRSWPWLLAGLIVLGAAGVILEVQRPCYFTEDDNFAQFLPEILYGCEAVGAGVLPDWNPLQYLGAPLAEVGTYALTYPVTYLSYAVARYGLGDRYLTLEVFCWLHLVAGYLACFWLGRKLGLAAPLASALGLSLALSGFALLVGRSWYYMTPVIVWAPLLIVALLQLWEGPPNWRWTLGTGLVIGLFFHAGNAQMWLYALGFAALLAVWSCLVKRMPWSRLVAAVPAGLIGVGLAAILLLPQMAATNALKRVGGTGADAGEGLLQVFVPYPMSPAYPADTEPEQFPNFYYAGSVLSLTWLAVILIPAVYRGTGRLLWRNPLVPLSVLALLLSLGKMGGLWTVQSQLPVLNQLNVPIKFLIFFHLFSCALGALVLERIFRETGTARRWFGLCFVVVAGLLLYHAFWARSALYFYGDRPYPLLPEGFPLVAHRSSQPSRLLPLAAIRSHRDDYVLGMHHNFPTVYGLASITGYDPIVEQDRAYRESLEKLQQRPLSTLRAYGVTHIVLHREVSEAIERRDWSAKVWNSIPFWYGAVVLACCQHKPVLETESILVYEVHDTTPQAFPAGQEQHGLPVRLVPAGVEVDVSSLGEDRDLVVNFLWRPGIRVYADGIPLTTTPDDFRRIQVGVKAGTQQLTVGYESPWGKGLVSGGVLIAAGVVAFGMQQFWSRFARRRTLSSPSQSTATPGFGRGQKSP